MCTPTRRWPTTRSPRSTPAPWTAARPSPPNRPRPLSLSAPRRQSLPRQCHPSQPAPPARPSVEVLDTGHVALSHTSREGETGTVWYRGPLTPRPTSRQVPDPQTGLLPVAHAGDQVRRVGPDGRENLGLATAFDI